MRLSPLLAASLATLLACSQRAGTSTTPTSGSDSRTISATELSNATQLNLYDFVKATRPRWLVSVGGDRDFPIAVYLNEGQLGPVETLKTMGLSDIRFVRYYDASGAQARFNRVHLGPVIQIVTR